MCCKTTVFNGGKNMPPKQKFTKKEIVTAALEITRRDGITALTARRLGTELGSSSRPIFTVFQKMDDVTSETIMAARALYNQYVAKAFAEPNPFKGVGMAYIQFAKHEPKLFHLLFMTENGAVPELADVLSMIDENSSQILETVQKEFRLDDTKARKVYQYLWIFTHGIAALCATKVCQFGEAEISAMLDDICRSILQKMKAGEK
jgi:DNA-binding transcriptional regulator YbjK